MIVPMFKNIRHIHFVGIGGSGMSGIAEVLLKLGYRITGSDFSKTPVVKRLENLGATVWQGHSTNHVQDADVVVTSTAVSKNNPEVQEAHRKNIPVIPRIEMLAELARLKYTIAIAGTHGKTTTSSLVAKVLQESGLDPTVIVGGRLQAVGTGGVLGKGDFLVAEADESDGSFLKLSPTVAIITNIDDDHLDYYKTMNNLERAFVDFADRVPFYGLTIVCGDDPRVRKIIPRLKRRYETYGIDRASDLYATHIQYFENSTSFQIHYKGQKLGSVSLALGGKHNVLNALAATAVGLKLELSFNQIAKALSQFEGVGRRIEFKGNANGLLVFDDYGHHPTEMAATVAALRHRYPHKKLTVLFQPHRYTRTQLLHKKFGAVLNNVDKVYLLPIYPAGEKPIRGVTTQLIAKSIKKKKWSLWKGPESTQEIIKGQKVGDVLLTLGAGDVWKVADEIVSCSNSLSSKIRAALPNLGKRLKTDEILSRHCTWAIGGPADIFVEVHNLKELKTIVDICHREKAAVFFLGWGSNVLLPDEGLRGCVIRLRGEFESIQIDGTYVKVGAGVHLPKLAKLCAKANLSGAEAMAGVPGTVGGALMSNAGTKRGAIGDVIEEVQILTPSGDVSALSKDRIDLRYRWSNLTNYWIIGATLKLKSVANGHIWEAIKEELEYRQKTQPLGTKNVGSVFKNPPNDFSARLIEAVGLKGHQIGRLRFSPKHANFIENLGGGTAKDALELIAFAQRKVKQEFNVDLLPEVRIIGPTTLVKQVE